MRRGRDVRLSVFDRAFSHLEFLLSTDFKFMFVESARQNVRDEKQIPVYDRSAYCRFVPLSI